MKMENKYKDILKDALVNGVNRNDRTGAGCKSIFNKQLCIKVDKRFPIITGRKIYPRIFKGEFQWFINGETNIKSLKEKNINIWNDWADEKGELGPVYGHQLRNYNDCNIDQLNNVINSIKNNPDSRRHIINLWNPCQLNEMALPPCYLYFQFFVLNNKINMFVVQRSADLLLGVPYDISLFSYFLIWVANKTNLIPNELHIQFVDAHVYNNHINAVKDYLATKIYPLPTWELTDNDLILYNYKYDKKITAPINV